MRIRPSKTSRNVLVIIGIFLVMILSIALLSLNNIEKQVRKNTGDALRVVVQSTHEAHKSWIETNKNNIRQLTKNPKLIALVDQHLTVPFIRKELLDSQSLKELKTFFDIHHTRSSAFGFYIISPDNITIGSMHDDSIGTTNLIAKKRPDLLQRAFNGETAFVPPIQDDNSSQPHSTNEYTENVFYSSY